MRLALPADGSHPVATPAPSRAGAWPSTPVLWAGWVLAGAALLAAVGRPAVQRTQEARVLETARQMLDEDARGWLLPELNGASRLRKPPLPYWMAAAGYLIGRVNETAGRAPTALVGWLTVGLTYAIGARLFGRRAGFFSAAALATSYLFFRHSRLAETDAPAALFVTLSVSAILRAAGAAVGGESFDARPPKAIWLHAAAAAAGLAFLSKGAPGIFPLLFLVGFAACARRWDLLRRFVTCGAPLTLVAVGGSWYAYAASVIGPREFLHEMRRLASGENHWAPMYRYLPQMLLGSLPWSGVLVAGGIEAVKRWRTDVRVRVVLVWAASILLPLLVPRNRQPHYLLPLMPALMVLCGWMIDEVCRSLSRGDSASAGDGAATGKRIGYGLLPGTLICTALAIGVMPIYARHELRAVRVEDFALAGVLLVFLAAAGWSYFVFGPAAGMAAYAAACLPAMAAVVGVWLPSLVRDDTRFVAAEVRRQAPRGPYCFYGPNVSLPLCFNLRQEIPHARSREELAALAEQAHAAGAPLVTVVISKPGRPAARLPETAAAAPQDAAASRFRFVPCGSVRTREQQFDLYTAEPMASEAQAELNPPSSQPAE